MNEDRVVKLGEIAKLLPSRSVSTDGDAEVRAITTACLTEGGFSPAGIKVARMRASDVDACTVVRGEILIARSNTPDLVGRAALFPGEPAGVVATDLTMRIWVTAADYLPSFLGAYLSSLYVSGYWKERAGGASASMKKITREQLAELDVPAPPLEEQQRIMVALTAQLAQAERVRAAAEAQLKAATALPAALLRRAFGGERP